MLTKPFKIALYVLLFLVALLAIMYAYRMFYLFNAAKVKSYATDAASKTGSPDLAYKLIIEGVEYIKASQDLTAQVKIKAEIEKIELEKAIVLVAFKNLQSSGYIGTDAVTPTNAG